MKLTIFLFTLVWLFFTAISIHTKAREKENCVFYRPLQDSVTLTLQFQAEGSKFTCLEVNSFSKKWSIAAEKAATSSVPIAFSQQPRVEVLPTRPWKLEFNSELQEAIPNSSLLWDFPKKHPKNSINTLASAKGTIRTEFSNPTAISNQHYNFLESRLILNPPINHNLQKSKVCFFSKVQNAIPSLSFIAMKQLLKLKFKGIVSSDPSPQQTIQTSGMAIASLVLGIVGWVFWAVPALGIICHILAIIFGAIGMGETSPGHPNRKGGRNLAIAGLVLGIIGLVFFLLFISILVALLN